ncbi:MAG TPA: putative baseplate assembly protein [Thermoanaerobaculia bacterium]|nr:putative baseplate assembly protein [Thermoanaerobaculia bacterium]
MNARYVCRSPGRVEATRASSQNGIEYLEVFDRTVPMALTLRQELLLVRFLKTPAGLEAAHVRIDGEGARAIPVLWAMPLPQARTSNKLSNAEQGPLLALMVESPENFLVVRTAAAGDFSTYRLRLVVPGKPTETPAGFDPRLAEVSFSFKIDCPTDFDCRADATCSPVARSEPELSYLAKDYASFRQLMFDRLSAIAPQWGERHAADVGVALVELFAYVGDHLSYYQDAAATEAYLGTARLRTSVRRHARMLDYQMHEGSNARAFVVFRVDTAADGLVLPAPDRDAGRPGIRLLTRTRFDGAALDPDQLPEALAAGATVFETMHDVTLLKDHNEIRFYTWSDEDCCLPAGATSATLIGSHPRLKPGSLLLFEEVVGPATGDPADADPRHRHVVRLTSAVEGTDPVTGQAVVEITWDGADALPFPLCISAVTDPEHKAVRVEDASVARGNVVLADHGLTVAGEPLGTVVAGEPFRPALGRGPLTFAAPLPDGYKARPAAELSPGSPQDARPAVVLREVIEGETEGTPVWNSQPDLLASDRFARELVVEQDEVGRAQLRFGDDVYGLAPDDGTVFSADYRIGNGRDGNVGRGALVQMVIPSSLGSASSLGAGIREVRNPLPAAGGREPQSLEEVRQFAPQAFRIQERAVTEDDYAKMAERHAEVQKAAATFRWTGSWHTVFLTVDRKGGLPVDADFERRLRAHMDRYRMAGVDLEVDAPRFVALDVTLHVCVKTGYLRGQVKAELLARLGSRDLPGGGHGLFHPDDWTFGQPVYLSRLYAAASAVDGVQSVEVLRFQRRGRPSHQPIDDGFLPLGRLEIARLDNDPNRQENGLLELVVGGGR